MTNQLFELFESGQMTTMTLPSHLAPLEEVEWFNRHYHDFISLTECAARPTNCTKLLDITISQT